MIIYRQWTSRKAGSIKTHLYQGWFLLGIIPLYIRKIEMK